LSGGLQGQGRLPLRAPRHRDRHRVQHQERCRQPGAPDVERPPGPEVEGQGSDGPPGLQRCHRHACAGARSSARLGLLEAARSEQAHARAVRRGSIGSRRFRRAAIAVNGGDYTLYHDKKKGNPVEIVSPKEGVPLVVPPSAITSFTPHPNAAKLFTDFIFSRELQQVFADSEGLYTGHPDVKYPPDRPKLSDLRLLQVDPEELEKRNEEIKTRFVEFFGA